MIITSLDFEKHYKTFKPSVKREAYLAYRRYFSGFVKDIELYAKSFLGRDVSSLRVEVEAKGLILILVAKRLFKIFQQTYNEIHLVTYVGYDGIPISKIKFPSWFETLNQEVELYFERGESSTLRNSSSFEIELELAVHDAFVSRPELFVNKKEKDYVSARY